LRRLEFPDAGAGVTSVVAAARDAEGVIAGLTLVIGGRSLDDGTETGNEHAVASFLDRVADAPVVEVDVDERNRIRSITPHRLLDVDLAPLVGRHVGALSGAFTARYGPILEEREVPSGTERPTTALTHEITCGSALGERVRVRSLSMPLPRRSDQAGRSRILLSAHLDR
jgi:hypothetical protein